MRGLYILLLAQISVQLQCDKTNIQATVGSTVMIICTYRTSQYRFSKKYWCAGDSRSSCEVRMDTDGFSDAAYRTRAQIIDRVSKGLIVSIRDLKLEDTGIYWVAIDKIYADLMTRIQVTVTKEAVDKPNVWPLSSLERTCWGEPVVFRCGSARGTNAQYTWYRVGHPNNIVLHHSSDLCLQCSNIIEDSQLFCSAYNDVSSQSSDFVTLQLLQPGDQNCVYLISSKAFSSYECIRSTTPLSTSIQTTESLSTSIHPRKLGSTVTVFQLTWSQNKTMCWSGLPLWYECLRWVLFSAMIIFFSIVHSCSKPYRFSAQDKHPKYV
ncbi:uncharacterized protein LOC130216870 [Danio aesculapii]|uniref:uncharacterized protein LOC130216870 n=1 Tax=Danio aesculapii TaxID=1142201 RepID=UPI0024BFF6F8|nr:uncharacterized protein LOC130216870 [Danio aesculapii]